MRFGSIDFPAPLLQALRDKRLVVFAGAGVSMGPPANLPSFLSLAKQIGEGRREVISDDAILDRELGALQSAGVDVHRRCIDILQRRESSPTDLHKALLRLFGTPGAVRLITTNFDPHFTGGSIEVWQEAPEIFCAPALPLGTDFAGIIHLHGANSSVRSIVLTDQDFGRAYLTEGWARRFLLDVFRSYTVLFVGYRHEETVMQYMARALPPASVKERYALVIEGEDPVAWRARGITPIVFPAAAGGNRYAELNHGVASLATAENRGVLDLKRDIAALAEAGPPREQATEDQVRLAIGSVPTLRFFTRAAKPAAWLEWLDARSLLDPLFSEARLDERGNELCAWAAKAIHDDSTALMTVVGQHNLKFNPGFWASLCQELCQDSAAVREPELFGRWLTLLLARPAAAPQDFLMQSLAMAAKRVGDLDGVLGIFRLMARTDVSVDGGRWLDTDGGQARSSPRLTQRIKAAPHALQRVWESAIAPHLVAVHARALTMFADLLEERHAARQRWKAGQESWDYDSARRAAIEPHQQDRYTNELKPIVDGARTCLEWAVANGAGPALNASRDRLWAYQAPLVKRLAVHAASIGPEAVDDKLAWLRVADAQHHLLRHEVLALLEQCYPQASPAARARTIDWVKSFEPLPAVVDGRDDARDWLQLDVLWRLKKIAPDCLLVKATLEPLQARHPDWVAAHQPDVVVSHTSLPDGLRPSPVSVDELLSKPGAEWVDFLLTYKEERPWGPTQDGLWLAAQEAAKRDEVWQRGLLEALEGHWESPIWSTLMYSWYTWPEDAAAAAERLQWLGRPELLKHHAHAASHVLRRLVSGPIRPYVPSLLPQADEICRGLCAALPLEPIEYDGKEWLDAAINRPSGALAEYVMDSIQLRGEADRAAPAALQPEVEALITALLAMQNGHAAFVRAVLASRLPHLLEIAPEWAVATIDPWLSSPDDKVFEQAWSPFILCGHATPQVAACLKPALLANSARVSKLLHQHLPEYVELYLNLMVWFSDDPRAEWIPGLLQNSDEDTRTLFASHLRNLLDREPAERGKAWWDSWLAPYWEGRLRGVPAPLDGPELAEMLGWPAVLPLVFPEAVHIAARMPKAYLEYASFVGDLKERGLGLSQPEACAVYLTAVLNSEGTGNLFWEVPSVTQQLDRRKISAATLASLEARLAFWNLDDRAWGPAPDQG